jgi:two-component system chemotaxis response regulator CheB
MEERTHMPAKHIVVIGASAGGIETLRELVRDLPADFPAPIAIVLHTAPQSPSILHEILSRSGALPAIAPRDRERLSPGKIYVAPPDYHLLVEPGVVRVVKGPRENRFRPAIDPLFRSAAQVFGPAAIGVILTGSLDDGSTGLWTIKQLGGVAIVQDPDDALVPSMPRSALETVNNVDYVVPLGGIAPLLTRLTSVEAVGGTVAVPEHVAIEVKIAKEEDPVKSGVHQLGSPSPIACPECHGVLLELKEANRVRFRCHTGHAYSAESLLAEINASIENALWNAIRSMQEGSLLMRQMTEHYERTHPASDSSALVTRAHELEGQAERLRGMVTDASPVMRDESQDQQTSASVHDTE